MRASLLAEKFLLLSGNFAAKYLSHVDHFNSPANAGRIDDFLKDHFESKIAASKDIYRFDGVNAFITINGPMSPGGPDLYDLFYGYGGVSYVDILSGIEQAKQDINPYKGALYLLADTPGGTVSMVDDVYQALDSCEFQTVAVNKGLLASGGMWIGAACDRIEATTPAAFTGSIGVVVSCYDIRGMLERIGVKQIVITNHEASEKVPDIGTDEGQKVVQEELNAIYAVFKDRMVVGRDGKITAEQIDQLKGGVKIAKEAVAIGLIDSIVENGSLFSLGGEPQPRAQANAEPADKGAGKMTLTVDRLRADHSELVAAIEAEAREGMVAEADLQQQITTARSEGATAERERILGIESQSIAGHDDLIAQLKADGTTSPAEAAVQILAAEQSARKVGMAEIDTNGNEAVPAAEGGDDGVDANAPIEERAKAQWDKDSDLRSEFGGNFDAYLAYAKNTEAGRARVLGKK